MKNHDILIDVHLIHGPSEEFPFKLHHVGEVSTVGNESFKRENHAYCTLEYIVSGGGYLHINGQSVEPRQGDVYFLHYGSHHHYYPDPKDPWRKIYFQVNGPMVTDLLRHYGLLDQYLVKNCKVEDLFRRMLNLSQATERTLFTKAPLIFLEILIALSSQNKTEDRLYSELTRNIRNFIHANIEKDISMQDIADSTGQSVGHITRKFSADCGYTPYEYLLTCRHEAAKLMLNTTTMPIKGIARKFRYADEFYFSRCFSKTEGLSPSQYRKSFLGEKGT